jgi:EmrB/QacA subfamily drug resistance transporter
VQTQNDLQQSGTVHRRRWAILAVLVVSLLVVVLDNTVLNVALRTIADPVHGLGASQTDLEWSVNSYTLVFAGLLFTAGILGDRIGRKRMLLIGLVLFGLASLASAYSRTPTELIWARSLMGIGAAAIMPSTLSIISNVFDPRERGRAIGVWAGAVGLGVAIGPVVGGGLLETFWWGSVFLINVPIILVGLVLVVRMVPESRDPNPGRVDGVGVVLSVAGLVAFVFGIIEGGEKSFGQFRSWGAITVGVVILAIFFWYEVRSDHPSLDVHLFRNPRFSAAVGSVGLTFFAALGSLFFLTFYLQLVRGYAPLQAGLLVTPFALAQIVFAPLSSSMVKWFGPKYVCAAGLTLVALGLAGFATLGLHSPIWLLGLFFFIQGVGMANVMPPATESIMSSVPREKAGVGSSVQNTVRQLGGSLGIAVLGALIAGVFRSRIHDTVQVLPESARVAASSSISEAYAVAGRAGPAGGRLISAANDAFVTAMHWAALVSALVALLGVVVVLIWLPRRSAAAANPSSPDRSTVERPSSAVDSPGDGSAPHSGGAGPGQSEAAPRPLVFTNTLTLNRRG